jgi:hypothetical protein
MTAKRGLPQPKPQDREKHPSPVAEALNPKIAAVRTAGTSAAVEPRTRPASELKELVRALPDFSSDELRQIPVVVPGSRLKPRAKYLDLREPGRGEFSAPDESYAGKDAWFVPKTGVAPPLWNRLLGTTAKQGERDGSTRHLPAAENPTGRGRERSERRGSSAVRSVRSPARHHRARGH